jgi:hypothetical protein
VKVVETKDAPKPAGHYSQGTVAGGFVFVAGQLPWDPERPGYDTSNRKNVEWFGWGPDSRRMCIDPLRLRWAGKSSGLQPAIRPRARETGMTSSHMINML